MGGSFCGRHMWAILLTLLLMPYVRSECQSVSKDKCIADLEQCQTPGHDTAADCCQIYQAMVDCTKDFDCLSQRECKNLMTTHAATYPSPSDACVLDCSPASAVTWAPLMSLTVLLSS